ncbi:CaiB/BaiF CoA transferase family protein [Prosthecomicrobium pneumaticum]|uniref:Crotonobetainyl-CoA:carnitine CoA-transferase CaiB-like acyl-CoA transferase n=1 Tax=Prosthecomicrobium pneumaticum TaxID=81895 RepID=A0A7W9FKY7_9HYPH|nr:CaiB/BaiF CoA-transferase family protein [Prosthecomicrobium pneumaticum]MBB5751903.1 crotonobetainyl-CoA:carnitine CoA-transferase CaiB-like acyl-CoA transferase [Prosthecomicrobium pneumaticum]
MLPLEGLLVVAMEQAVAAPTCTVRLADAGARVIKIERAEGETARHYDKAVMGTSAYFAWLNRGKESIVLDVKDGEDRALLERMVARADVFVQNFVPGATARLGLGSADLVARYPRLIAVDIVGYGQDTAYRDMRAYDMLIQAESGVCAVTGTADEPVKVGVSIADVTAGATAHAAVLEALIERSITGRGKAIEIAMFDAMADLMSVPLLHHDYAGKATPRAGLSHAAIWPYGRVACSDGELVVVVQNPAEWRRFCSGALGRADLADDPRFLDNPSRVANRPALEAIMAGVFGALTRAELIARLEANALAWSNVSTVADLSHHPALRRIAVETPGGTMQGVASPLRREIRGGAVPALGAHTAALRSEFAA